MSDPQHLVEVVGRRAAESGTAVALTFHPDTAGQATTLTYAALDTRARHVAAALTGVARPGDRALLMHPHGADYVVAFLGCLYAGVIAVPLFPPATADAAHRRNRRLVTVGADAEPAVVLTVAAQAAAVEDFVAAAYARPVPVLATDTVPATLAPPLPPDPGRLAYLQYTSGSTSTPKGVMVSHGNLAHNLSLLVRGLRLTPQDAAANWLPLFHDMGLVCTVLLPLYAGIPAAFMSPAAFIRSPLRWLSLVSETRATMSIAPDFAFALCAERAADAPPVDLDLSRWDLVPLGAEPIRASTLERFTAAFAPAGFRREAFCPSYGLAEVVVAADAFDTRGDAPVVVTLSGSRLAAGRAVAAAGPEARREIVSCGRVHSNDHQVIVVDPETRRQLPAGAVGEIWLGGPSVAQGYWRQPSATEEAFGARLADGTGEPFLRTGDLGFLDDHRRLSVTGRRKDLLVVRGRNVYPHDVEWTVQDSHPALQGRRGVVFASGETGVVVVQALRRNVSPATLAEACVALRRAVGEEHQLVVESIALVQTRTVPVTSSGKLQRGECRRAYLAGELPTLYQWSLRRAGDSTVDTLAAKPGRRTVAEWLTTRITQLGGVDPADISPELPFVSLGIDSKHLTLLARDLGEWLGRDVAPATLFEHSTIARLTAHLAAEPTAPTEPGAPPVAGVQPPSPPADDTPGVAADHGPPPSVPGTAPIAVVGMACRFPGADSVDAYWRLLAEGRTSVAPVPPGRWAAATSTHARRGGFVDGIDLFDADFFGINPLEARSMDPQHRLLLTVVWQALEDAGIPASALAGSRTGVFVGISTDDYRRLMRADSAADAAAMTGNSFAIAASRISYQWDLRGPSWAVDTACSSSLVALHQARASLLAGECDLAVVAGVNLMLAPETTDEAARLGMLSVDGLCKTFDADANGYVRGEGCGALVLRRLADARRAGDAVHFLLVGSAVNNDGRTNGLTAPNGGAQREVVRQALSSAGVRPVAVDYVEAHGTGTVLGDPVEMAALQEVFDEGGTPLWVGSVKTNIGHLEAAAGIAGVIKAALALRHATIPAHLHLTTPNPLINLDGTRAVVPTVAVDWPVRDTARLAGVSSFGFGGANAHVVLSEAPPAPADTGVEEGMLLLPVSARDETALEAVAESYATLLDADPAPAAMCHAAATRRDHYPHRRAVVGRTGEELATALRRPHHERPGGTVALFIPGEIAGEGMPYPGMGGGLYRNHAGFRAAVDRCDEIVEPLLGRRVADGLWQAGAQRLDLTSAANLQPALFVIGHALAEVWGTAGLRAEYLLGQGVGEYVAACHAGVLSLADALRLVVHRGRLSEEFGGTGGSAGLQEAFARVARTARYLPPQLPLVCSLTGRLGDTATIARPEYWVEQLAAPAVDVAAHIATLGCATVIEAGASPEPGRAGPTAITWVPSLSPGVDEDGSLLAGIAKWYMRGGDVDWAGLERARRGDTAKPTARRLPHYPLRPQRHWYTEALERDAAPQRNDVPAQQPSRRDALLGQVDAGPEEARRAITVYLAVTIGVTLDDLGERTLGELGVDSLTATRLREVLLSDLGIDFETADLLGVASVAEIVDDVYGQLLLHRLIDDGTDTNEVEAFDL